MEWYDLTPELSLLVPHCPEPTQVVELRRAARQFCQDTQVWVRPVELWVVPGVDRYEVPTPDSKASVIELEWLSFDGKFLQARNTSQLTDAPGHAPAGRPEEFYQYPGDEVVLAPVPDKQYQLAGSVVLQPRMASETLPEWLGNQWGDAIISLAAARLAAIPMKTWSQPAVAQAQMGLYTDMVRKAKAQKTGANKKGVRVARYGGL